jgi:hypothetical protein
MQFFGSGIRNNFLGGWKQWGTTSEDASDNVACCLLGTQHPLRGADGRSADEATSDTR